MYNTDEIIFDNHKTKTLFLDILKVISRDKTAHSTQLDLTHFLPQDKYIDRNYVTSLVEIYNKRENTKTIFIPLYNIPMI